MPSAVVGVQRGNAILQLIGVRLGVSEGSKHALFFPAPQREADGTARSMTQRGDRTCRFKDHGTSSTVVLCSCAEIPRVQMCTNQDPFVGMLAAADFSNDVVYDRSARNFVVGFQFDPNRLLGIEQTAEQLGVLHANLKIR